MMEAIMNIRKREEKGNSLIDFPNNYVVIDIETTGFDPNYDEIIEISAIKVEKNDIIDSFTTLINPKDKIDSYIEQLTGISNDMLSGAPILEDILKDFDSFIGNSIIVGHNVNFDINFLYDNYMQILGKPLKNNFVDTLRLARKLLPGLKHHRLDDLTEYFNRTNRDYHRALNDCELTNQIFNDLKEMLKKHEDIEEFKRSFQKHYKNQDKLKAKDIIADVNEFDVDNLLYQKVCVFTGALERMPRKEAMQIVVNLGGICGDGVTSKTNYLILGNNDYCKTIKDGKSSKQKKAEELKLKGQDIEIISEDVFYDMIDNK